MTTRKQEREDTAAYWSRRMTDDRLAHDLERLADDIRWQYPVQRAALLREAARRIREGEGARTP